MPKMKTKSGAKKRFKFTAKGKVKETVGHVTGDKEVERQGKNDQRKADLKQAGEKVKDAFND